MKIKKSNSLIGMFSIFVILSVVLLFSTDNAFALSYSDRDHDGVLDDLDECPQFPETYNKFEDTDGCPDSVIEDLPTYEFPDSDGDGIEDRMDKCVNHPENFNGYLDEDGCPELKPNISDSITDSDSDSIPDTLDACPNEKEVFNEFKDGDGCPDSLDGPISKTVSGSFTDNQCRNEKVAVMRINTNNVICVSVDTAKKWEEYKIAKIVSSLTEDEETYEQNNLIEEKLYNEMLNPRQVSYPNHLGFNDLHIEAINHLIPDGDDSVLDMVVHHHCKVYDDMTAACLLFPTGMRDQDKPYGIEYVIGADSFAELPEDEKKYWHYHRTELPNVHATLPDLTSDEAEPLMPTLNETYGKVVYFWKLGDKFPIGDPFVVVIEDLYKNEDKE